MRNHRHDRHEQRHGKGMKRGRGRGMRHAGHGENGHGGRHAGHGHHGEGREMHRHANRHQDYPTQATTLERNRDLSTGTCPLCESHCPLSAPGCGKGAAYRADPNSNDR